MRVLIVDDSIVFRTAIKTALLNSNAVTETDVASNGKIACEKLQQKEFDGVTLDLEMPVMDGIETIKKIREFNKTIPIIIFSAQNLKAANKTMKALEMGANDFVQKLQDSNDVNENLKMIENELVPKFKALVEKNKPHESQTKNLTSRDFDENRSKFVNFKANLICIGSSTGGPDFLMKIFKGLEKLDVPVLIVQHMPPVFTTQFANTLDTVSSNKVVEAKVGDILEPGTVYIAPGDFHMTIKKSDGKYLIDLNQNEKVCYVRPAVDVLFQSVVETFQGKIGSFIFTGMGSDGANGCLAMRKNGENVVGIQDEESSVVWGMPGAVFNNKAYDAVLKPDEIINAINKMGR